MGAPSNGGWGGAILPGSTITPRSPDKDRSGQRPWRERRRLHRQLCAMPNGSSILRLIDAVLKETQRQARGAEARKLIQYEIQRVAAISVAQGLLQDPDGITRINIWDLLTAICLTARKSVV